MLPDEAKTKEQLINELAGLRQRLAELEALETTHKQVEKALRLQSEIVANMVAGVLLTRVSDRMMVYANSRFEEMFGYGPGELIGKNVSVLNAPGEQTPEEVVEEIIKQLNENGVWYGEVHNIKKDGTRFWCRANISTFEHPMHGKVDVNVLEDITERKWAEEALRESEERYRALMNLGGSIGEAIVMLQDRDGVDAVQIFVSDEWPRITGYSRKELLGMSFFDLLHPKYRQASLKRHRRKMQGETLSGLFEMVITRKDGTEVPIELTSAYTTYKGERANVAFIRDITERKRAEEALRDSEDRFRTASQITSDVVYERDLQTGVATFYGDIDRHLGYEPGEYPHTMEGWREHVHPEDLAWFDTQSMDQLEPGVPYSVEYRMRKKDGTYVTWLDRIMMIWDEKAGRPIKFIGAATDITERKQAEEREKELQRELNLSSRLASIGELAAGVAHEINNPLTGILAFSERLLRKSTDEKTKEGLAIIHNEAQRVARVVENLRVFARRSEPKKEYSDINEILGRTLELRAYELKTSNIEVETVLDSDIPRAMVDFQQLQQVFLNIVLNAEQVMTEANSGGKLTIKTQPMKGYIRVSFTDDGPGIPTENLDRVFDPFFTTREERGGTGLGLSLCHGIVTEHGGRIYARSKPRKGATFFVELPLTSERQIRLDEANIGLNHK